MLIVGAEVDGARCDVRLARDRVADVAPTLARRRGEEELDAEGGALLPGLHDHHLHLLALAAALGSARCGPPEVRDAAALAAALAGASPRDGWIRGVGYHESVAGSLDRDRLDALGPRLPVRVQHRSGALWIVNSRAIERLGLDALGPTPEGVERDSRGRATGRLFRLDGWLRERMGAGEPPALAPLGALLARAGVTGVTDATVSTSEAELRLIEQAAARGDLLQRIVLMGGPGLRARSRGRVKVGAVKLILDEAALPEQARLCASIAAAHDLGRPVAIHCVTRATLVFALAAFSGAGCRPGDRVEHASVAPPDVLAELARLPLTIVTQPGFVSERGDAYLADVEPSDRPWLYRAAGVLAAGVPLGGGTDAPFGAADPWAAMAAAVTRRTQEGRLLGPAERLTPERALALFTTPPEAPGGAPRRVAKGALADLCLLDRPWQSARSALSQRWVRATWIGGRLATPVR